MSLAPRVVVVHRHSEYDELLARHSTRQQAAFYLRSRGRDLTEVAERHQVQQAALAAASAAIPVAWRQGQVERGDLDRFLFADGDIIVVVGPDGLVANTAKYLDGQPVIGLDPEPGRGPGILVRHPVAACADLLHTASSGGGTYERRSMVHARVDDGRDLLALNEIFLGHPGHQSARYQLYDEHQSSSGLLVSTGTGATGWARSITHDRGTPIPLPAPEEPRLAWFVREAWPSPATGTTHTQGLLDRDQELTVTSETDGLVVFGDGIETDRLTLAWGQRTTLLLAARTLDLLT